MSGRGEDPRDPPLPESEPRRYLGFVALTCGALGSALIALATLHVARGLRFAFVVESFRTGHVRYHPLPPAPASFGLTTLAVLVGVLALSSRKRDAAWLAASMLACAVAVMGGVADAIGVVRHIGSRHGEWSWSGSIDGPRLLMPLVVSLSAAPVLVAMLGLRRRVEWALRLTPLASVAPLIAAGASLALASLEIFPLNTWRIAEPLEGLHHELEHGELLIALATLPALALAPRVSARASALALALGTLGLGALLFVGTRPLGLDALDRRWDVALDPHAAIAMPQLPPGATCDRETDGVTRLSLAAFDGREALQAELVRGLVKERREWALLHAREPFSASVLVLAADAEQLTVARARPLLRRAYDSGDTRLRIRYERIERWETQSLGVVEHRVVCERELALTSSPMDPRAANDSLASVRGELLAIGEP